MHGKTTTRKKVDHVGRISGVLAVLLFLAAALLLAWEPAVKYWHTLQNKQNDQAISQVVSQWPAAARKEMIEKAKEYNAELATTEQAILGSLMDDSKGDKTYENLLNVDGKGMMGSISIPSLNVELPIYHGTDGDTLQKGAGHEYGSSLPVGGTSTRAVIAAHNGLAKSDMFRYIGKLKQGDEIKLNILDQTLTYKVTEMTVVNPSDVSVVKIVKGKDLLTLITCTGQGNSKRMIVTGERSQTAAVHQKTTLDWRLMVAVIAGVVVLLMLLLFLIVRHRRKRRGRSITS